jgi:DNA-directed RNA polymerase specialized sigma24 family protein
LPTAATLKLRQFLLSLLEGGARVGEPPAMLTRMARKVLRDSRGGREPMDDQIEDLVQEFLVKLLTLRATHCVAPFADSSPLSTASWTRTTLHSLAVDSNPYWDTQRSLREIVKLALRELPSPIGQLPCAIEANSRFVRKLVGQACAELVQAGLPQDATTLSSALMGEYGYGTLVSELALEQCAEPLDAQHADLLEARQLGAQVAAAFLEEAGIEGRRLLAERSRGLAALATVMGLAVATVHERYLRAVDLLRALAARFNAGVAAMQQALEALLAVQ